MIREYDRVLRKYNRRVNVISSEISLETHTIFCTGK